MQKRNSTYSKKCLIFNALFQTSLILYCAHYSDINRTINGYDDCGYICGKNNSEISKDIMTVSNGTCTVADKASMP